MILYEVRPHVGCQHRRRLERVMLLAESRHWRDKPIPIAHLEQFVIFHYIGV